MPSFKTQEVSYKTLLLIYFVVQFTCWAVLEFLEHKMGMQPAIRRRSSFSRMANAHTSNTADRKQYAITQRRLTKTLDNKGRFRIQTRGSIYLIKALWQTAGFIYCIYELVNDPNWFIQHFYYLNEATVITQKVQNICVLVIAYYSWEMATNRYAKLQKSIAAHHWLSCIAAITIIYLDRFSPLITLYAIIGLFSAGIPINVALCIRASSKQYKKMNKYIKGSLKFAAYWYLIHLVILFIGSCVIVANHWISGYYENNIGRIVLFMLTILSFVAFFYNDIITLRALFELSYLNYALLSENQHKKNKLSKSATTGSALKSKNQTHSQIDANNLKATDVNDPDSYWYEAYPISGTKAELPSKLFDIEDSNHTNFGPSLDFTEYRTSTELTQIPTDLSGVTGVDGNDTDLYTKRLYLDAVNTDGRMLPMLHRQLSLASYLSNDSRQFAPIATRFTKRQSHNKNNVSATHTPFSSNTMQIHRESNSRIISKTNHDRPSKTALIELSSVRTIDENEVETPTRTDIHTPNSKIPDFGATTNTNTNGINSNTAKLDMDTMSASHVTLVNHIIDGSIDLLNVKSNKTMKSGTTTATDTSFDTPIPNSMTDSPHISQYVSYPSVAETPKNAPNIPTTPSSAIDSNDDETKHEPQWSDTAVMEQLWNDHIMTDTQHTSDESGAASPTPIPYMHSTTVTPIPNNSPKVSFSMTPIVKKRTSKRNSKHLQTVSSGSSFGDKILEEDIQKMMATVPETDLFTLPSGREMEVPQFGLSQTNKPKNAASMALKMNKNIQSTPIIKISSPECKEENNMNTVNKLQIRSSLNQQRASKLKLKGPNNPTHLSVNVIRLKRGNYSHKNPSKMQKASSFDDLIHKGATHRKSQTLPNIDMNGPDIRFKPEILPSQIEKIQSDLPPHCEVGVFQMTDKKEGTQQQVVVVKYLKINATPTNTNNINMKETKLFTPDAPYTSIASSSESYTNTNNNKNQMETPDNELIECKESKNIENGYKRNDIQPLQNNASLIKPKGAELILSASPSDTTYNKEEIVDVFIPNDDSITITNALEREDSESMQTKWLKKLISNINEVFSPQSRIDDGIYLDFDEDELIYNE